MRILLVLVSAVILLTGYLTTAYGHEVSLSCPVEFGPIPDESGLIAYYPLDGNTADVSGNGQDAIEINAVTPAEGKVGQGYHFNGKDSFVRLPVDITPTVYPQITVTAWIKPEAVNGTRYVINQGDHGNRNLFISNGVVTASSSSGLIGQRRHAAFANRWIFVALTYDQEAGTATLLSGSYLSAAEAKMPEMPRPSVLLGAKAPGNSGFVGTIDEVRIYNRALTVSELAGLKTESQTIGPSNSKSLADNAPLMNERVVPEDDESQVSAENIPTNKDFQMANQNIDYVADGTMLMPEPSSSTPSGSSSVEMRTTQQSLESEEAGEEEENALGQSIDRLDAYIDQTGQYLDDFKKAEGCKSAWELATEVRDVLEKATMEVGCPVLIAQGMPMDVKSCLKATNTLQKFRRSAKKGWNSLVARNGWGTIGPRDLEIGGSSQSGTIVSVTDRKFVVLDYIPWDKVRVEVEEPSQGFGKLRTDMRICTQDQAGAITLRDQVDFNVTESNRNAADLYKKTFSGLANRQLIIVLNGTGYPATAKFKYTLRTIPYVE